MKSIRVSSWPNLRSQKKSMHGLYHQKLGFDITCMGEKESVEQSNLTILSFYFFLSFDEDSVACMILGMLNGRWQPLSVRVCVCFKCWSDFLCFWFMNNFLLNIYDGGKKFLQKLNTELPCDSEPLLFGNTQKNWNQGLKEIFVSPCS